MNTSQKILYIEDKPQDILLVRKMLFNTSYRLLGASSGTSGLKYARYEKPDLILIDISLPDFNGFEIIDMLRNDPHTKHIPIIVVTADTSESTMRRAREIGLYISKPIDQYRLLVNIEQAIGSQATFN